MFILKRHLNFVWILTKTINKMEYNSKGTVSKTIIAMQRKFHWNFYEWINRKTEEKHVGWGISISELGLGYQKKDKITPLCKKYNLLIIRIGERTYLVAPNMQEDYLWDFTNRIYAEILNV